MDFGIGSKLLYRRNCERRVYQASDPKAWRDQYRLHTCIGETSRSWIMAARTTSWEKPCKLPKSGIRDAEFGFFRGWVAEDVIDEVCWWHSVNPHTMPGFSYINDRTRYVLSRAASQPAQAPEGPALPSLRRERDRIVATLMELWPDRD